MICGFVVFGCAAVVWFGLMLHCDLLINSVVAFIRYGVWFGSGDCLLFMFG